MKAKKETPLSKKKGKMAPGASENNAGNAIRQFGLHYTCMRLSANDSDGAKSSAWMSSQQPRLHGKDRVGSSGASPVQTVSRRYSVPLGQQGQPILGDFWVREVCIGGN